MQMKKYQDISILLLRFALAFGFLSAVASRLSLWGQHSSGWDNFVIYAGQVNSFAPENVVLFLTVASTILETSFAIMLLVGFKTRLASVGAAILTLLFSLAMTYSFGIKEPLDYSVFVVCTSAFLLSTVTQYRWSIDELMQKRNK
jgi:putative oxidoreductase